MEHLLRAARDASPLVEVAPAAAGWRYLDFRVVALPAAQRWEHATGGREVALVPLRGRARVSLGAQDFALARETVFAGKAPVLYAPPGCELAVQADTGFEFALGGAPAEGRYPVRLFRPDEMKVELRGGGPARRQVNHILATPLPAERLILFEVYVPGGAWSGWPPHRHDGHAGSPYLEEVYHYRFAPEHGFGVHRNYRPESGFDEIWAVRHADTVLVTQGFHPTAAAPGSNMYFLNYLAGELQDEARGTPPVDDADFAWMKTDWEGGRLPLPVRETAEGPGDPPADRGATIRPTAGDPT